MVDLFTISKDLSMKHILIFAILLVAITPTLFGQQIQASLNGIASNTNRTSPTSKTVLTYTGKLTTFSHCPGYDWIQNRVVNTKLSIVFDPSRPGVFTVDGIVGTYVDNNGNFRVTKIPPVPNASFIEGFGQSTANFFTMTVLRTDGYCYYKQTIVAYR